MPGVTVDGNDPLAVYEAADIIRAHPTMSEALMEACNDALGRCIHLPKKRR